MTQLTSDYLYAIKQAVRQSIEVGQAELLRQQEEQARRLREQNEGFVRRAKGVLDALPELVQAAVLRGERRVVLIDKIRDLPWTHTGEGWAAPITILDGWQRIVADACAAMDFVVSVQRQHDGGGADSWHQLVLSW